MITADAEKIVNAKDTLMVNDDIETIIQRGEHRTAEIQSKYETLNLEDLSNFKSDASVQKWDGEDFRGGVRASPPCLNSWDRKLIRIGAEKTAPAEPAVAFEARAQVELFGRQLFQGYAAGSGPLE